MEINYDPLIFGKSQKKSIVGIEINDSEAELFIQKEDGSIDNEKVANRFWLLSNDKLDNNFIRLKGDLHYKWGRQFENWKSYSQARGYYKDRVWGIWDKKEALMVKDGYTFYKGMQINEVSVLAFDIETTGTKITSDTQVLIIANTFRDSKGTITRKMFCYDEYESTKEFIDAWTSWVRKVNPSVIIGHNIYNFDIPMLYHIAKSNKTSLYLGRDGSEIEFGMRESRFRKDGSQTIGYRKVKCYGVQIIDTMFLSIKYDIGRKYESYGLKAIIKHEGLEKENRQFYDASQIKHNYRIPTEWELIKKYAEEDGDDALALYDLMMPPFFYMANSIPKTPQLIVESASGSQINAMLIRSYLQNAHSIPVSDETSNYVGAISLGIPGVYKNCFKQDVSSLYPSIIIQYEIYDKLKDPNKSFLNLVDYFTNYRLTNKKLAKETGNLYYSHLDQSGKILVNSMYGMLAAPGLQFNSPGNAAKITLKGREILSKAIEFATSRNLKYWESKADPEEELNE